MLDGLIVELIARIATKWLLVCSGFLTSPVQLESVVAVESCSRLLNVACFPLKFLAPLWAFISLQRSQLSLLLLASLLAPWFSLVVRYHVTETRVLTCAKS